MTPEKLKEIETELSERGYRKYTTSLTSTESWAWFKTFDKEKDEEGSVVSGYQVAFRVWDFTKYNQTGENSFGMDFWTSPLGTYSRMDFTANIEPFGPDIPLFESMAHDFHAFARKYENKTKSKKI